MADVHGSVRDNHGLRKCVDTILTKVRNTPLFVYLIKFTRKYKFFLFMCTSKMSCCIYSFYSQVQWDSLHLSVISFQCPTEYREEMESDVERSDGEQNVPPTKRGLVNLHKKVLKNYVQHCTVVLKQTMQK